MDRFAAKTVVVAGVGSGGSKCVEHLVKSGVSRLVLIDPDELAVENVCRHVCGLPDLGRPKVEAVADFVRQRNPQAQVRTFRREINEESRQWLCRLIAMANEGLPASLVICGTDTERSKQLINAVCVEAGVPAVFAGCFEKACGGEVIRYRPGEACYGCIASFLRREGVHDAFAKKSFDYSSIDVDKIQDARPEPGLGLDIESIALIQARMALLALLGGQHDTLPDIPGNYLLFGNRPVDGLFTGHLQCFIYRVQRQEGCLICGLPRAEEAKKQARTILARLTSDSSNKESCDE